MSLTLHLKPETEADLLNRALASGQTVDDYVETLLGEGRSESLPFSDPEEWIKALNEWVNSHRYTPPLSDEAISRESMYAE